MTREEYFKHVSAALDRFKTDVKAPIQTMVNNMDMDLYDTHCLTLAAMTTAFAAHCITLLDKNHQEQIANTFKEMIRIQAGELEEAVAMADASEIIAKAAKT